MVSERDWDPFKIRTKKIEDAAFVVFPANHRKQMIKLVLNWLNELFKTHNLGEVPQGTKEKLELGEIVEFEQLDLKIRIRENSCRVKFTGKAKQFETYITLTKDIYPGED